MVLGLVERLAEAVVQGSAVITCVIIKDTLVKFIGLWSVSVVDIERNDFIISYHFKQLGTRHDVSYF